MEWTLSTFRGRHVVWIFLRGGRYAYNLSLTIYYFLYLYVHIIGDCNLCKIIFKRSSSSTFKYRFWQEIKKIR